MFGKQEWIRPLRRLRRRWDDNIKINQDLLMDICCIHVSLGGEAWRGFVNITTKFSVCKKWKNFDQLFHN
jgi:hypothetical protein